MDHFAYKSIFGIYEPSVTVVSKPKRLGQEKTKQSKIVTKSCEIPKLVLELYEKNRSKQ